ncbi:MAG: hypothetical protein IKL07_01210 [Clostridium sp.]|nr:hypothetical protein [Clostridium sp.]
MLINEITREERQQVLEIAATHSLYPFYATNRIQMKDEWMSNPQKYIKFLDKEVIRLLKKVQYYQQAGKKGRISFIIVSFLRSSAITEKYELSMCASNELGFLDPFETEIYFDISFLMNTMEDDLEFYKRYIIEHMGYVEEWELQNIKEKYYGDYLKIVEDFIKDFSFVFEDNELFNQIDRDDSVTILFTGYHDLGIVVRKTGEEVAQ